MTKTNEYRKSLNELQALLPPNDYQYFDKLRQYLLTQNLFADEEAINLQLLTMLQDLRDAEQDGLDAETFSGNTPAAMANAILAELPRPNWRQQFQFIALLVFISWFFILLNSSVNTGLNLNLFTFLAVPVIEIIAISLIFKIFHHAVYTKQHHFQSTTLPLLLVCSITVILIIVVFLFAEKLSINYLITIPNPWGLIIQALLCLITLSLLAAALVINYRNHHHNH